MANRWTPTTLAERIMEKVSPEPNSGCWLWDAAADAKGYGRVNVNGKITLSHRASYAEFRGPVSDEDCVLHKCNVPACINPDHLYIGDRADNWRDVVAADHVSYGERHPGAKLTDGQAREIHESNERGYLLAERYGVSAALVCMIRKGKKRAMGLQHG